MKITVSLVTYNHRIDEIEKCINSVLNSPAVDKFYIIDHSPSTKLQEELSPMPLITYLSTANNGFGAGHNVAIRLSIKQSYPYHLIVNPDVWFENGTIEKLLSYIEKHNDVGLVAPRILYPDGRLQYHCKLLPTPFDWFVRGFCPSKRYKERLNRRFELHDSFDYNHIADIPYLNGSFMLFRNEALQQIGLFDERYFMYCEDCDITRRIRAHYQTIFYPHATIFHAFNRESHRNLHFKWIQVKSTVYYFNKWGWWNDRERQIINRQTLSALHA